MSELEPPERRARFEREIVRRWRSLSARAPGETQREAAARLVAVAAFRVRCEAGAYLAVSVRPPLAGRCGACGEPQAVQYPRSLVAGLPVDGPLDAPAPEDDAGRWWQTRYVDAAAAGCLVAIADGAACRRCLGRVVPADPVAPRLVLPGLPELLDERERDRGVPLARHADDGTLLVVASTVSDWLTNELDVRPSGYSSRLLDVHFNPPEPSPGGGLRDAWPPDSHHHLRWAPHLSSLAPYWVVEASLDNGAHVRWCYGLPYCWRVLSTLVDEMTRAVGDDETVLGVAAERFVACVRTEARAAAVLLAVRGAMAGHALGRDDAVRRGSPDAPDLDAPILISYHVSAPGTYSAPDHRF